MNYINFTYLKKIFKNRIFIIFLIFQSFIFIYSIFITNNVKCFYESYDFLKGCEKYKIQIGNTLITDKSSSVWQFIDSKMYSSELITNIASMKYFNIYNTTYNDYVLMKGNIVIYDDNINEYVALLKDFLLPIYYNNFHNEFIKEVNMNDEIYDVAIHNSFLQISFLNNCSTNTVLYEDKDYQACSFNDETYNNINNFLNKYFKEKFVISYTCIRNCNKETSYLYNIIKYSFIYLFLNILLILCFILATYII